MPATPSRRTRAGVYDRAGTRSSTAPRRALAGWAKRLADPQDVRAATLVAACVLAFEVVLCAAIIVKVPCELLVVKREKESGCITKNQNTHPPSSLPDTEIDWEAYMDEVGGYLAGERDYTKLAGGTGPLVYPAGFVHLYALLKRATAGAVRPAQWIFGGVYLASQATALAVTVAAGVVPPVALPLLALSKRLHSIYLLRCFNDGVAALLTLLGTLVLARGAWIGAVLVFSAAVSVKMSALLAAPPVAAVMLQGATPARFAAAVAAGMALQLALAAPFLTTFPRQYMSRAFEFSRVFMYKWSVNWQMLPEPVFLGKPLATALLAGHLLTLAWFWGARWSAADGGPARTVTAFFASATRKTPRPRLNPAHVVTTVAVGNFVGIVFARSLHYQVGRGWVEVEKINASQKKTKPTPFSPPCPHLQFYAWYAHTLPLLLWSTRLPVLVKLALFTVIEAVWCSFPPSALGSTALLAAHGVLLVALAAAPVALPARVKGAGRRA